ncbi:hypothetical protein Sviol_73410 [Streptomyces violascens]|uniref:IclR-ED domain-containing protein n=1 Tax=Streptomyces violascens TaxID=67381 RepID=A0ABQ3R097_9ACTN|nr:hypothetical protein Sviol_73410 [Streptomyces violascens]
MPQYGPEIVPADDAADFRLSCIAVPAFDMASAAVAVFFSTPETPDGLMSQADTKFPPFPACRPTTAHMR